MADMLLQPGTEIPAVTVPDQDGNPVSLSDFKGQKVILFFYPKDNTPGCTKEACNLRDNYEALQQKGFTILGVSSDSEKSHRNFIGKHELPFTLLSDPEQELQKAFGVWGEKKMYGKTYMGTLRTTFIIDENGVISHTIKKVKTAAHTEQILELLEASPA